MGLGAKVIDLPATAKRPKNEQAALRLLVEGEPQARIVGPDDQVIDLPADIYEVICFVAEALLAGKGVSVVPRDQELTTTQAAEMLNVSRPFLIKQLGPDKLPFHMVGSHRRIRLNDLLEYQTKLAQRSREALERMAQQAEELGLYED